MMGVAHQTSHNLPPFAFVFNQAGLTLCVAGGGARCQGPREGAPESEGPVDGVCSCFGMRFPHPEAGDTLCTARIPRVAKMEACSEAHV